jgi:predicted permease
MAMSALRIVLRRLFRAPVFFATSVATLSLAIGLNSAVFSVADAVLFRPLPYESEDQLFFLRLVKAGSGRESTTVARELLEQLEGASSVEAVAARAPVVNATHVASGSAELIGSIAVSADFLPALGVRAVSGRSFTIADEEDAGRAIILTYSSWRSRFGGDPSVIGQSVTLAGYVREVVGVLPPDFIFPAEYLAFSAADPERPHYEFLTSFASRAPRNTVEPVVRIRRGATPQQAEEELKTLMRAQSIEDVPRLVAIRPVLFPVGPRSMQLLLLAAAFVVCLGCVNLSHLALVQFQRRRQEFSISMALGATRATIIRGIAAEAGLTAVIGTVGAMVVAVIAFEVLLSQLPSAISNAAVLWGPDLRSTIYTMVLGAVTAVLVAMMPVLVALTLDPPRRLEMVRSDVMRSTGVTGSAPIVLQIGLAVVLVGLAMSAAAEFWRTLRTDLGISPNHVLVVNAQGPRRSAPEDFYTEIVRSLEAQGDVLSVGATEAVPLSGVVPRDRVEWNGAQSIPVARVLSRYFETAGIPLLRGRPLRPSDRAETPAPALVSQTAARLLFQEREPIGQPLVAAVTGLLVVVGVVDDVRMALEAPFTPLVYTTAGPAFDGRLSVVARFRGRSPDAVARTKALAGTVAPTEPVSAGWWSDRVDALTEFRLPRFRTIVLATVAGLAMSLAAIGVFGVASTRVRSRSGEIAIRTALGATPSVLTGALMARFLGAIGIGLVLGTIGIWAVGKAAVAIVGLDTVDLSTGLTALAVVSVTALASTYVPVRQALRRDCMAALKE